MARQSFGTRSENASMASLDSERYPESVSIDLDNKDPNAYEVEVVDDTPEEDRGRPNAKRFTADEDEDLSGYADKTRKRIERLKFETHSARRQREQAERERDEAVEAARQREAEIADLRRRLDTGSSALAGSMIAEREARLTDAKRRLAQAHADGDSEAIAAATADMSTVSAELAQIRSRAPAKPAEGERQPERREPERAAPAQPILAPKVARWIDHNRSWFNKDSAKTNKALSIHHDLVAAGIRPDSDEYTRQLDKRMKQSYPDHEPVEYIDDGDAGERKRETRRTDGGEPTGRAQESREQANSRRITLTSTELAIAKKLGVTPQAYAAEKAKRVAREGNGA